MVQLRDSSNQILDSAAVSYTQDLLPGSLKNIALTSSNQTTGS